MQASETTVRRAVLAGSTSNLVLFAANLGTSFFLAPFLIARLGEANYGRWVLAESLTAYFTLLDLGASVGLVRFVAGRPAGDRNRYVATAFLALAALAGIGLLLALPFAGEFSDPAFLVLCLVPAATGLPMGAFAAALDGLGATATKSGLRAGLLLLRTAVLAVAITHSPTLICLGTVLGAAMLLEQGILAVACLRRLPGFRLHWDRAAFGDLAALSRHAFPALLAGRVAVQSGPILLGCFLGAPQVAGYAVAFRLVDTGRNALRTMTATLAAAFGHLAAHSDLGPVRTLFKHATRWALYAAVPLQIGLWHWGGPFLRAWLPGGDLACRAEPVLGVLAATLALGLAQSVAARILYGLGDLRLFAHIALLEAGTGVVLACLLIPDYGPLGLAVAVAAPNALAAFWTIRLARQRIGVGLWEYCEQWLPPHLCGLSLNFFWTLSAMLHWPAGAAIPLGLIVYAACVVAGEAKCRIGLRPVRIFRTRRRPILRWETGHAGVE